MSRQASVQRRVVRAPREHGVQLRLCERRTWLEHLSEWSLDGAAERASVPSDRAVRVREDHVHRRAILRDALLRWTCARVQPDSRRGRVSRRHHAIDLQRRPARLRRRSLHPARTVLRRQPVPAPERLHAGSGQAIVQLPLRLATQGRGANARTAPMRPRRSTQSSSSSSSSCPIPGALRRLGPPRARHRSRTRSSPALRCRRR